MNQAKQDMIDLFETINNAAERLQTIAEQEINIPGDMGDQMAIGGMKQFAENVLTECGSHETYFEDLEGSTPQEDTFEPLDDIIERMCA